MFYFIGNGSKCLAKLSFLIDTIEFGPHHAQEVHFTRKYILLVYSMRVRYSSPKQLQIEEAR